MTAEEIRDFITARLFPKKRAALVQSDFSAAWAALSSADKDALIASAIAGKVEDTGKHVQAMLNTYARGLAEIRADEITADGSLDIAEFNEIFD